jgi:hypothetical protein
MKPGILRPRIHIRRDALYDFDDLDIYGPALYRFFSYEVKGKAVYIGKSEDALAARLNYHSAKPWFPPVHHMAVQLYGPDELLELKQDEAYLIRLHQPRHNKKGINHLCQHYLPRKPLYGDDDEQCPICGRWHWADDYTWHPFPDPRR